MPLAWNEIRTRACAFVIEWKDKAPSAREEADAQTFQTGFLNIFGVSRAKVAIFEKKVKMRDGADGPGLFGDAAASSGYIDLFWKGHILIEMKSPGKDMIKAYEQAKGYANALPPADLPKGILICDFNNFNYYNLEEDAKLYSFTLVELTRHIEMFGYLAGYTAVEYKQLDPVNIEAAENMGRLHDRLKETGYEGHQLEVYLVRLMFCLFADDTGIFEKDHFIKYIIERTGSDGSDLAPHLHKIFEILNTPQNTRLKTIDEQLNQFPYIDGDLFDEQLRTADFDTKMRETLIDCCRLDWSKISPAIFGAMFQSVMNPDTRHDIGAHYTSEENILKVIHPLFLDDLWQELDKIKSFTSDIRKSRLGEFHNKIAALKFLDPACGCGNFLVISYRELRLLEIEVIKELLKGGEKLLDIEQYIKVNVDQFYGIEILEFPCRVAQTALWLMDHLMNMKIRDEFGQYYIRIPLRTSPSIHNQNALPLDWETVVPKTELSYILGNPPFLGKKEQSVQQKAELINIFDHKKGSKLDYVTCWYKKAVQYIKGTNIEVAFVSTNSICQGEHVPILWPELINKHGLKINFAHQTFKWSNEARGKAAVHCVIVGFSLINRNLKKLYQYASISGNATETIVSRINAYLVDAETIFIESRSKPMCRVPEIGYGNIPIDNGHLILSEEEASLLISQEPDTKKMIRPYYGGYEFINNKKRFCLWLDDISPSKIDKSKFIKNRIEQTRLFRLSSDRAATRCLASVPSLFGYRMKLPNKDYLLIPKVSSENRLYVPIGFMSRKNITNGSALIVPRAGLYEFGILTSAMHMAWMRCVCGRMKSDYQYSASLVYNNFPWPSPKDKQRKAIEDKAQDILDVRKLFSDTILAILYNPPTMPPKLAKAHQKLDEAVEKAYGRVFDDDTQRVAYLFELYQKLSGELFKDEKKRGKGRKV